MPKLSPGPDVCVLPVALVIHIILFCQHASDWIALELNSHTHWHKSFPDTLPYNKIIFHLQWTLTRAHRLMCSDFQVIKFKSNYIIFCVICWVWAGATTMDPIQIMLYSTRNWVKLSGNSITWAGNMPFYVCYMRGTKHDVLNDRWAHHRYMKESRRRTTTKKRKHCSTGKGKQLTWI